MAISPIDWAIVAAYFLFCTVIGLYFTRRGGKSLSEYFLSGRQAPWWLAGTAMVATTFAADTPLVVTALVATKGVAGNWLWWNFVMSGMLTVFFFARLWRRAEVMTDVELAELRYGGGPAAFLRGFRALYLAIPINLIILGWVTRAMIKILTIALGLKDVSVLGMTVSGEVVAVGICFAITAIYAVAAGMWAVMWTDLVQFIVKMSAVIVLAVYSVRAVGGIDVLKAKVIAHFGSETAALSVLPVSGPSTGAAAYMSTVATHLNWGASYLVNDFYKRFLNQRATEAHYVAVSRVATVLLFFASMAVTSQLTSIEKAWELLLALGAGTGLVLILRWYWWRINAWSEISAMIASFAVSLLGFAYLKPRFAENDPNATATIMLVTVACSTVVWLAVTLMTRPEPDAVLEAFYRRVRPGGPGWARVSTRLGFGREPIPGGALAWTNWIAGIVAVYATLFGIGKIIFGELGAGILMLAVAAAAFYWISRSFASDSRLAR